MSELKKLHQRVVDSKKVQEILKSTFIKKIQKEESSFVKENGFSSFYHLRLLDDSLVDFLVR